MAFPECNSASLLNLIPCYKCLSMDDLQAIETYLMCQLAQPQEVPCNDAAGLRDQASCLTCIGDDDLKRLQVAGLCALLVEMGTRRGGDCDPETLLGEAKCLRCLPPHDLRAIYAWLFCKMLANQALPI